MTMDRASNSLRRARLAARLELRDLEARTRISPVMLRYIDDGQFEKLPAGIYARAWVRTVAVTLGLDADDVLREVEDALRPAEEVFVRQGPSPGSARSITEGAAQALKTDSSLEILERSPAPQRWRRSAAAALDGILLSGVSVVVWMVATGAGGGRPTAVGLSAAMAITLITLVVAAVYFVLFAGIGGRTPGGAALACPPTTGSAHPLHLREIGRRALEAALQEGSIVLDWILTDVPMLVERRRVQV
jgi:hypothetical protein